MKYLIMCMIMILGLVGGCGTSYWTYTDVKMGHAHHVKVIPIWVDTRLDKAQMQEINKALTEWNYVLNGHIQLKWVGYAAGEEGCIARLKMIQKTGLGWVIAGVESDDPAVSSESENTLAFVRQLDGHLMFILKDRIGTRSLKNIVMHEMGHLLGSAHLISPGLMVPNEINERDCIDKITVAQVAAYQHLELGELNYCVTPHFE